MTSIKKLFITAILFLTLVSFYSSRQEVSRTSESYYSSQLKVGDSLSITSQFDNCFNEESFQLKIVRKANHLEASLWKNSVKTIYEKQLPEETIKDLIDFERTMLPNHSYGIGSSCMIIYSLNNRRDTVFKCPDESHYRNLIEKITN